MNLREKQSLRDKRAYEEGVKFLLQFDGVTQQVLEDHFKPTYEARTLDLTAIYERMLHSAANVGRNINTIRKHVGLSWGDDQQKARWQATKSSLYGLNPFRIVEVYGTDSENWASVWRDVSPNKALPPRTVIRFCKSIISAASFITQFENADDFCEWVEFFDNDTRARAALPMIIDREVDGFGFALACDFIKDLGYVNFPKPDIHVRDICEGLELCPENADDYQLYKSTIRAASSSGISPYVLDKVFYLIGSANFDVHPEVISVVKAMPNRKEKFIAQARAKLEAEGLL